MQYTRPDIMYAVNRLPNHYSAPSAPVSQGINHFTRYLDGYSHSNIAYTDGLDNTATHDLCQEVSTGYFYSQNISNGLVDFADGGEGSAPKENHSIACIILIIFVVAVY